ncbi:hypothetical protein PAXRUDRAFT_38636, partial [Paxillus rubicundulus Ve08.2h10]
VAGLKERCSFLEVQLGKVTLERDTIKTLYDQLTASLQGRQSSDPDSSVAVDDPTGAAYPNLCFWTQSKYSEWTHSPEAHSHGNWKTVFIENINGVTVSKDTLKAIRKAIRVGWIELINKGIVPESWGRLCASGRALFHSMIEKLFPIFKLAQNGWKLDLLCSNDYPGWVRNNTDDEGSWIINKVKCEEDGGEAQAVS